MSWPLWRVDAAAARHLRFGDIVATSLITFIVVPLLLIAVPLLIQTSASQLGFSGDASAIGAVLGIFYFLGLGGLYGWLAMPVALVVLIVLRRHDLIGLLPAILTGVVAGLVSVLFLGVLFDGLSGATGVNLGFPLLVGGFGAFYGAVFWCVIRWKRPAAFLPATSVQAVFK